MILELFNEHEAVIKDTKNNLTELVELFANKCIDTILKGNKIVFMGNGGSAADCQHLVAEFVGRFKNDRKALPAIALTTDTSILTSIGNDYGFDMIFTRQVEALVKKDDLIVAISTSGNSENINKAVEASNKIGGYTIGLTGKNGGRLKDICNLSIVVPSMSTARIQETHILIGHIVCEYIEKYFEDKSL